MDWFKRCFCTCLLLGVFGCVDNGAVEDSLTVNQSVTVNDGLTIDTGLPTAITQANQSSFTLSGNCSNSSHTVTVVFESAELANSACTDGKWSATVDISSLEGSSALKVNEMNGEKAVATLGYSIFVDLSSPTVVEGFSPPANTSNPNLTLTLKFSEKVKFVLSDPSLFALSNLKSIPVPTTTDQVTYNIAVETAITGAASLSFLSGAITDLAGNPVTTDLVANWNYTQPPAGSEPSAITLTSPASTTTSETSLEIAVSVTAVEAQAVKLYNAPGTSDCTTENLVGTVTTDTSSASFSISGLSEGVHRYRAVAQTITGGSNCSAATLIVTVDQTPPQVTGLSNDTDPKTSKSWSWGCNDAACNFRFVVDSLPDTTPTGAFDNTVFTQISGQSGVRYLHVQAQDLAGNTGPVTHVSASLIPSSKSPPSLLQLSGVSPTDNDSTPSIQIFGVKVNDEVRVFKDSSCQEFVGIGTATSTSVTITTSALTEGSYSFYATANESGEISACSSAKVDYIYTEIMEASSLTLQDPASSPAADSTPTVRVSVTASADQTVELYNAASTNDCDPGNLLGSATGGGATIDVTVEPGNAFSSSGTYTLRAVTKKTSIGATLPCSAASVSYEYDATPPTNPTISSTGADANTWMGPTLSWSTSTDASSGMSHYEMAISTSSDPLVEPTTLTWTNIGNVTSYQLVNQVNGSFALTPGDQYYAFVRAVDNAQNQSTAAVSTQFTAKYMAVNVGAAVSSQVVGFEASTPVVRNTTALTTLATAGAVHGFSSVSGDRLYADKPFYVAGKNGAQNITWNSIEWAGTSFAFANYRSGTSVLRIYALADSTVTVTKGGGAYDSLEVSKGAIGTINISQDTSSSYEVSATAPVLLFHAANTDPFAIFPVSNEVIGFKSNSLRISTTANTATTISDAAGASFAPTVNLGTIGDASVGTGNFYASPATLITAATSTLAARSEADAGGSCAASFVPTSQYKKKYAINVDAFYVAIAAKDIITITVTPPVDPPFDIDLAGTGPYDIRLTNLSAGTIIESANPFAAWYEPATNTNAADDDETVMFGW